MINIEGELLRAAPITSRRLFSDALDMAPGIGSRNVDDGVGPARVLLPRLAHLRARLPARRRAGLGLHRLGRALDGHGRRHGAGRRDQARRRRCVDAAQHRRRDEHRHAARPEPVQGLGELPFQPMDWNSDNTKGGAAPGGLPTSQSVNQWDLSLGGRIIRDKVWFFATYRYADLENGISRTPTGSGVS